MHAHCPLSVVRVLAFLKSHLQTLYLKSLWDLFVHTPEVSPHTIECVICDFGWCYIWCWCLWVLACSRPARSSPFHPIAKTMLFNEVLHLKERILKLASCLYVLWLKKWNGSGEDAMVSPWFTYRKIDCYLVILFVALGHMTQASLRSHLIKCQWNTLTLDPVRCRASKIHWGHWEVGNGPRWGKQRGCEWPQENWLSLSVSGCKWVSEHTNWAWVLGLRSYCQCDTWRMLRGREWAKLRGCPGSTDKHSVIIPDYWSRID